MMITDLALLVLAATAPAAPPRVLTLEEALRVASAQQPQLRQATAATQAAVANADAVMSPLLPQVGGSASYQRATGNISARPGSSTGQTSSSLSWESFPYYTLGLSASQLIYDFGQSRSRWRSAQASADAQRTSERTILSQVFFGVRSAYFQARAAKSAVTVAVDTLANQQKHLDQIQGFVDVGTRPEIDLAQAKTDVANADVQLITAQNAYAIAKAQLNQAMGVEGSTDYDVADETQPPVEGEDDVTDVLLEEALKARPEIAALQDDIRAQELNVRAIQGALGPSLVFSAGFTDAGQQTSSLAWNWDAGLGLSIPIFQGGQTRAQIRQAQANLANVHAQAESERLQVRLEVEQARLTVLAARTALTATGEALVNAKDRLRLAEGRYETGVGSIIELGDAQLALTSAAYQQVQAEYALAQARAGLIKALGRD
ncbi:MAG TPA: TolC family protein [Thermoanaerobaculaceae bacterium]|nr:TolC family protein [Thermoanaerobaculaceae bacterium]